MYRAYAEATGAAPKPRLLLAFTRDVRYSTVIDVIHTAGRLGIEDFGFVIERDAYEFGTLPFRLPVFIDDPPPEEGFEDEADEGPVPAQELRVSILSDAYRVLAPGEFEPQTIPRKPELLRARVLEICDRSKGARVLAESDVRVADLVEVLIAVRGRDCAIDGSGECCFPRVDLGAPPGI